MKLLVDNQPSEISMRIKYPNEEIAKTIINAVDPDNFQAPKDLKITMSMSNAEILIEIKSSRSIGNLLNTIDDLLECISAAEKVLKGLS